MSSYLQEDSNSINSSNDQTSVQSNPPSQQPPVTQPPAPQNADLMAFPIPNPPDNNSSTPPRTLWMGDLDPWSDEESIVQLWNALSKRVLVKIIKAKRGTPAANLNTGHAGYCFIEFETYEDAQQALSLNGSTIPNTNRVFRLNWASGATLSSPIPQTPEFSLFVGDLSANTTEAHLLALFQSHFNSVKTVRVMTDPITGASRCFGFVRFSDEEERRRALVEMQGVWLAGRPLRVALATPRNLSNLTSGNNSLGLGNQPPAGFNGSNQMLGPQGGMSHQPPPNGSVPSNGSLDQQNLMFMTGPPPPGVPFPTFYPPPPPPPSQPFTDPTNTTVFVGGLASGIPEATLLSLFQPFGSIINVKIPPGKGCGFVRFEKREDAERAIAGMQGFTIGGSRVRLSWGRAQNSIRSNSNITAAVVAAATGGYPMSNEFNPNQFYPPFPNGGNNASDLNFSSGLPATISNVNINSNETVGGNNNVNVPNPTNNASTPNENNSNNNDNELEENENEDSKLQEMYRAAAIGRLDSLNN